MAPKFLVDPDDTLRDLEDESDEFEETMHLLVEAGTIVATCDGCRQSLTPEEFDIEECPRCGEVDLDNFVFSLPS